MKQKDVNKERFIEEAAAEIDQILKQEKLPEFYAYIKDFQPYDLGLIYKELPESSISKYLLMFKSDQLAEIVQSLSLHRQGELFERLDPERMLEVMQNMDRSDLIRFLNEANPKRREELLSRMHMDRSSILRTLLEYPPDTAGRLMSDRYHTLSADQTVQEVLSELSAMPDSFAVQSYLYVTDHDQQLIGVVSYSQLINSDKDVVIRDMMRKRVVSVETDTDQEEAAHVLQRYEFVMLPVVDQQNRIVGVIQLDDVIDIVMAEANEDIAKLSGGGKDIDFDTKPLVALRRRLPWLILLLLIGLVSGSIVDFFEDTLNQVVALAFFMPMIAGMTGNTGTQSLAVVVRGLIGRKLDAKTVLALIRRELSVGIMIGAVCGILITFIAYFWQGSMLLGLIIGVSLFTTLIIGTLTGTCIPLILSRFKVDPAVASGPLITTLNDILSLFIYFGIASHFLSSL